MRTLAIVLAGVVLASAAAAAAPAVQQAAGTSWTWWLHPKLGMVKVDRATGFMIVSGRQQRPQAGAQR